MGCARYLLGILWFTAALAGRAQTTAFATAADLAGWRSECGAWSVQDGALVQTDAGTTRTAIWFPATAWADVDLSVEFLIHPAGDGVRAPGIVYRAQDQETYCYVHFDLKNSQVVWVRSAPGKEWTDARRHRVTGLKAGVWQSARLLAKGGEHQVFLDGRLLFTEQDDTLKGGVVGLRAGQGHIGFRNLRVTGTPFALPASFEVRVAPCTVVCADAGAALTRRSPTSAAPGPASCCASSTPVTVTSVCPRSGSRTAPASPCAVRPTTVGRGRRPRPWWIRPSTIATVPSRSLPTATCSWPT